MKTRALPGIRETTEDFDGVEREILKVFQREIYLPLLKLIGRKARLENAERDPLEEAVAWGRITFSRGRFSGKFDAELTRALRSLGAVWDSGTKTFYLPSAKLTYGLRTAIQASEYRFDRALEGISKHLSEFLPQELAAKVNIAKHFDRTLHRIDKTFESQIKSVTVVPKLTPETRAKVAAGYTEDLQRYIEDFTRKEVISLREKITKSTLQGNRYETVRKSIETSYGVSRRKAQFLARQETALMMASFKAARYQEAGITHYRWQSVVGSPNHPVRPTHKHLNDLSVKGKLFRFDDPPVTSEPGEPERRNNPGQDYNCRCIARPVVKF